MTELFLESIALINLPFTILFGLIMCYWLLVILGAADTELFHLDLDGDLELDVDAEPDIAPDGSPDVEVNAEADMDAGGTVSLLSFLKFFYIGEVPFMILLSILVTSLWSLSVLGNYYLNPEKSLFRALALLAVNLFCSLFITKLLLIPLHRAFASVETEEECPALIGQTGVVTTNVLNNTFGEIEVPSSHGPPILVNASIKGDEVLHKGDEVIIYEYERESRVYYVEKYKK